jgi:FKBP-type peptidyl-prolyl cis-trans isomerase FkpA
MHLPNSSAFVRVFSAIRVPVFLFFLFSSCSSGPFPGYTNAGDGFYIHLIQFGDNSRKIKEGDIVTIDFAQFGEDGKIDNSDPRVPSFGRISQVINAEGNNGQFMDQVASLSLGDSASIIRSSEGKMRSRMEVRILNVQTKAEYEARQKHLAEVGDIEENQKLKRYLADNKITIEPVDNGLYLIPVAEGKGDSVKAGKVVTISYKGYFLDGRQFDGTKDPLEFPYSSEMQVLEGIHKALSRMKQGDKSKIIIPSHFAFGERGSSTGVVPPFTTVVYEVEVINVK